MKPTLPKKLLSLALCLCMVLSLLPITAWAAEDTPVARVTMGGSTTEYLSLTDALTVVSTAAAEDEATLTVLEDITLAEDSLSASRGVFTIDLNGHTVDSDSYVFQFGGKDTCVTLKNGTLKSTSTELYAIYVDSDAELAVSECTVVSEGSGIRAYQAELTVKDCSVNAKVYAIGANNSTLTVEGGSLHSSETAIQLSSSTAELKNVTVSGVSSAVYCVGSVLSVIGGSYSANCTAETYQRGAMYFNDQSLANICDATISASGTDQYGEPTVGIMAYDSNITLCGGSIRSEGATIYSYESQLSNVLLSLNEAGEGTVFYDGLRLEDLLLEELLDEGLAYWQGDIMLDPSGAEITGGDVTVKPTCTHEGATLSYAQKDSTSHLGTYSCCSFTITESHSIVEDGTCGICGYDPTKLILICMADSCGDGWAGNAIEIYENDVLIATATIEEGSNAESMISYDAEKEYKFYWVNGGCPGECSFEIRYGTQTVFMASGDDCDSFVNGQLLNLGFQHSFEAVVTPPTCTTEGYTTYTCTLCGTTETTDTVAATGHSFGADGICAGCGADVSNSITVNMTDEYGDSWNGNAIEVYEDGVLIATVTVETGATGTWTYIYDTAKEYSFYWVLGYYPSECSFEILYGTEVVYSADGTVCESFSDGFRFFPACTEHVYGEGTVVAPTCTEQGYTLYTCTLCGFDYKTDYKDNLGGHQETATVVPPTCTEQGYTLYTCDICGNVRKRDKVAPTGHTPKEGSVVSTAPTCTEQGYSTATCAACGELFEMNYVDPAGHVLGEDGNCIVCGELYTVEIFVAETQITSANMADVLGDGTVSYDPATNTLTLNGFVYDGEANYAVYSKQNLNIVVIGENSIVTPYYGMYFDFLMGEVHISGTGSLTIRSGYTAIQSWADSTKLFLEGSVTFDILSEERGISLYSKRAELVFKDSVKLIAGTEDSPMGSDCIYVSSEFGVVTVTDNASISGVSNGCGLLSYESDINIKGNSTVDLNTAYTAIVYYSYDGYNVGKVSICENATVNVVSDEIGIEVSGEFYIGGNAVVDAITNDLTGIIVDGTITISDNATVNTSSVNGYGLYSTSTLTVTGGSLTVTSTSEEYPAFSSVEILVSDGKVYAQSPYIAVYTGKLTISGGTLEVSNGGIYAEHYDPKTGDYTTGEIILGEGIAILEPVGGSVSDSLEGEHRLGIVDAEGNEAMAFVIGAVEVPAKLYAKSLSLKGDIAINFYMDLSDEVAADEDAYMEFTKEDGTVLRVPLAKATRRMRNTEDYHVFSIPMATKQMADTVKAQFVWSEGSTEIYTYSVTTYVDNMLNNSEDEALKEMLIAMLHYGASAQIVFSYHTDRLANEGLDTPNYADVYIDGYAVARKQGTALVRVRSASLTLESKTTVRFVLQADPSVQTLSITYAGEELTYEREGDRIYVAVEDICAMELDEMVTLTVNDGTETAEITYSPLTYCQNIQNSTNAAYKAELKTLVAALYVYNQTANEYFSK